MLETEKPTGLKHHQHLVPFWNSKMARNGGIPIPYPSHAWTQASQPTCGELGHCGELMGEGAPGETCWQVQIAGARPFWDLFGTYRTSNLCASHWNYCHKKHLAERHRRHHWLPKRKGWRLIFETARTSWASLGHGSKPMKSPSVHIKIAGIYGCLSPKYDSNRFWPIPIYAS